MAEQIERGCAPDPILIAEFILDECEHEFGVAPCTATGDPCYKDWNNCRDRCNFQKNCDGKSIWMSTCDIPKQLGIFNYLPWIVKSSIQWNPSTALLGETFSTRGGGSFCVRDLPHTDQGFDPYWPRDGFIPLCPEDMSGTLISRWVERVKYFEGRRINLYSGHCDMEDICDFNKQSFLLDNPRGPNADCEFCFEYKDIINATEGKQVPDQSDKKIAVFSGDPFPFPMTLGVDLDGVPDEDDPDAAPFSQIGLPLLVDNYHQGEPEQDACILNTKHICIDGEALPVRAYTNNAVPAGWNFFLEGRAACGSTLKAHERGAEITLAKTYPCGMHIGNVICDVLIASGIEETFTLCCEEDGPSVIDFDALKQWICENPHAQLTEDVLICEPEDLNDLLSSLSVDFGFLLLQKNNRVFIRSIRPECEEDIVVINTCDIEKLTYSVDDDLQDRFSQIIIRHAVRDWTQAIEEGNHASTTKVLYTDVEEEQCDKKGWAYTKTKEIDTRWFGRRSEFLAQTAAERLLLLLNCPPKRAKFSILQSKAQCLCVGDKVKLQYRKAQNMEGEFSDKLWMVQSAAPIETGVCHEIVMQEMPFDESTYACFTCEGNCPSVIPEQTDDCNSDCLAVF